MSGCLVLRMVDGDVAFLQSISMLVLSNVNGNNIAHSLVVVLTSFFD